MLAGWMMESAQGIWVPVFRDDFSSDPSSSWTYEGVSNALNQALFRYDAAEQRVAGEWDQGNAYNGAPDPQVIRNSRLTHPLGRVLTDRDTFRFGATIRIQPGTIPDTLEFFQIANFGLYNLDPGQWGDDRGLSDNFSGNTQLVRDANDLIEFNYFINNNSFGFNPFIQGTLITALGPGQLDAVSPTNHYVTGTGSDYLFNDTDMGLNNYLPTDSNLFVEVVYHGASSDTATARRVYMAIYTDEARTNRLLVNGRDMFYWTKPAPPGRAFRVSSFGLLNWASVNYTVLYGGSTPDGAGAGSYDEVYVDVAAADGEIMRVTEPGQPVVTWAAVSNRSYAVLGAPALEPALWTTSMVVTAQGVLVTVTTTPSASVHFWNVQPLDP